MRLRTLLLVGSLAWMTASWGCGGSGTGPSAAQAAPQAKERPSGAELSGPVGRAVAVAREVEGNPNDLDAILERHGLTPETFEDLLYEISSDPELSKAYNAALEL